jgi:hypothetical protein
MFTADHAEVTEDHVADAAIHRARHQQRQQRTGRADDHAGDHQRRVLQHVAFEADREAGERVVQRDDDGHVRAADRHRHEHAEDQRTDEERADDARIRVTVREEHDVDADCECREKDRAVQDLLAAHAPGLVDLAVELRPRDQRA